MPTSASRFVLAGVFAVASASAEEQRAPDAATVQSPGTIRCESGKGRPRSCAVYTRGEIESIGDFVARHDLYVLSDEIYETLVYGEAEHVSIASLGPELRERTVLVNGVSKTWLMNWLPKWKPCRGGSKAVMTRAIQPVAPCR